MALIPGVRRHTSKARLCLIGVPECPLDVPEYSSDGPSYNSSDNGMLERGEPASAYVGADASKQSSGSARAREEINRVSKRELLFCVCLQEKCLRIQILTRIYARATIPR